MKAPTRRCTEREYAPVATDVILKMNMIENIEHYISIQTAIVRELTTRGVDLWCCYEKNVRGWNCDSHGEHICCTNVNTGAQVEIPLLTANKSGIDAGHFKYYLESIGIPTPSYSEIQEILARLECDGELIQVQVNDVPAVWGLAEKL